MTDVVERYLELGLRLGRHVDGLVDAYYGPPELADPRRGRAAAPAGALAADAGRLLADLDAGDGADRLDAGRRRWIRAQALGLRTTRRASWPGTDIGYVDEVERATAPAPRLVPRTSSRPPTGASTRRCLPWRRPLAERYIAWREAQAVPPDKLEPAIGSLADDLRERTERLFGLPDGEHVDFDS